MDAYLETSSTTVSWNWEKLLRGYYEKSIDENKMIVQESFGGELSSDVVSETGEWLDDFLVV